VRPFFNPFPHTMFTQAQLLAKVQDALQSLIYNHTPDGLYAPVRYALSAGGKRIRPTLMLMAYNLYCDRVDAIMPQALALEIYHNFTLLHDDLMDCADMRRGRPCVHVHWDENTAILSGDTMLVLAYRLFIESRLADHAPSSLSTRGEDANAATAFRQALQTFTEATLGVCEGQQYDMEFEEREDVTEAEYMEMIRQKTSLLLAAALKIGAQLAQASATDAEALYTFGEKIGLAFQLQDDLLDVYGEPEVFGKRIGGDILCNKKTFMLINAYQRANVVQREELTAWLRKKEYDPDEKIAAVRRIYDELSIQTMAEQRINDLFSSALQALNKVQVDEERKTVLRDFAYYLMGRKF